MDIKISQYRFCLIWWGPNEIYSISNGRNIIYDFQWLITLNYAAHYDTRKV